KATMVYEAEFDGVLAEIIVDEGSTAALGATIARATGTGPSRPAPDSTPQTAAPAPAPVAAPPAASNGGKAGRARATPVARRLANELGVELGGLQGTGPGGRIVRADVRDAAGTATPPAPTTDAGVIEPTTDAGVIELTDAGVIELTPTQRTIAARMA